MFLLSQQATNFYDFACYAKAKMNVEQLLYLDGTISHMSVSYTHLFAVTAVNLSIKAHMFGDRVA